MFIFKKTIYFYLLSFISDLLIKDKLVSYNLIIFKLVCIWCVYGVYMVCIWCVYGVYMECIWCVYGVYIISETRINAAETIWKIDRIQHMLNNDDTFLIVKGKY